MIICREKKERAMRRAQGLPSESEEDEEDFKNGDPFKRYSKDELDRKVFYDM